MAVPEHYDDAGINIKIDQDYVFEMARVNVPALGGEIADSVSRVVQIWNDLKLSWVGNTAQEAQDFNDRWSASISELFGGGANQAEGLLSRIGDGVTMAAVNYGRAEDVVTTMFSRTADALQTGGGVSAPAPQTPKPDGSSGQPKSVGGRGIPANTQPPRTQPGPTKTDDPDDQPKSVGGRGIPANAQPPRNPRGGESSAKTGDAPSDHRSVNGGPITENG